MKICSEVKRIKKIILNIDKLAKFTRIFLLEKEDTMKKLFACYRDLNCVYSSIAQ